MLFPESSGSGTHSSPIIVFGPFSSPKCKLKNLKAFLASLSSVFIFKENKKVLEERLVDNIFYRKEQSTF